MGAKAYPSLSPYWFKKSDFTKESIDFTRGRWIARRLSLCSLLRKITRPRSDRTCASSPRSTGKKRIRGAMYLHFLKGNINHRGNIPHGAVVDTLFIHAKQFCVSMLLYASKENRFWRSKYLWSEIFKYCDQKYWSMKSISIGGPLQLARKFVDIPWQRH